MYKILIADDESLARVGLQTMILAIRNDVEVVGLAQDGKEALQIIHMQKPDLVISDIKMPIMDGLELARQVEASLEHKPLFIFLTSYEDFSFARTAIKYRAFDYLIKMEFNRDTLLEVLHRAFQEIDRQKSISSVKEEMHLSNIFISRFYYTIFNGGFISEEQIIELAQTYEQNICASSYIAVSMKIQYTPNKETAHTLYSSILNSVKMALEMHVRCNITPYNYQTLGILILLNEADNEKELCDAALSNAATLCYQYFNIRLLCGVGRKVFQLLDVSKSFSSAQHIAAQASEENPILYSSEKYEVLKNSSADHTEISNTVLVEKKLMRALEHCDTTLFEEIISQTSKIISGSQPEYSINLISSIIHLIINCLEGGEKILAEAFRSAPLNYQSLYSLKKKEDLHSYLKQVGQSVTDVMYLQKNDPKYRLVTDAKNYIKKHIDDKLSLNDVASAINISPNYLSTLFKLYGSTGFSDYVARRKIEKAQALLKKEHLKIYQVSEMLGFDNPQYFSKVYKKYTGYSPSEAAFINEDS